MATTATQSFLNNVDETRVQQLAEETKQNSIYFTDITEKVVQSYSADLDGLMQDLYAQVTQPDKISTSAVERYYAELTSMLYFMVEKIEKLNVYSDMSRAARQEIYNKALLESSSEKDERGKSKNTVSENQAVAETAAQYESVVSSVYEHAYKTLKMKVDAANEMVSALKHIIRRRTQEEYLSGSIGNNPKIMTLEQKMDEAF